MAKSSASRDGGGGTIAPLTNSTKLFLQRLLVAHVVTDDEAQKLYDSIKSKFAHVVVTPPNSNDDDDGITDHGYMGNNLDHCFGIINASLVPGFELELRTVSLPVNNNDKISNDNDTSNRNKRQKLIRYHCITNNTNDNIAKVSAYPISKGGPHEMAYFRLVIERIVERGNEILNDDDSPPTSSSSSVGCPGMLNKMELINLRTELDDGHKDKLSIEMTELALQCMIDEKWLVRVVAVPPAMTQQQRGADGDDEEDDDTTTRKKRKSSNKRSSSSSLKGTYYGIGPRTFMECSEFLHKAGLASERMPQSILHRI